MAKSKKLGYSEVNDLSQLSMEDLQSRFYALAQRAEQRQAQPAASGSGQAQPQAQKPDTSFAGMDLGDTAHSADDFQNLTIDQLEEKYLDPATLEMRPSYADGSAPERAIMKAPSGSFWERTKLAFTNLPKEKQVAKLEEQYGAGNVKLSKGNNLTVRQNGAWYQLDPVNAGEGSLMDKAYEKTQDILADNADLAVSLGVGIPLAAAALPVAAGLGLGAVATGAAVGAYTGVGTGATRVLLGRLAGTYEATAEETIKDIGIETLLSMAGGAFVPGVKYTASRMGSMWQKAAPNLKGMDEVAKNTVAKVTGTISGVGEDNMRVVMDNADQIGKYQAQYKGKIEALYNDQIDDVQNLALNIKQAEKKWAKDLYGQVALDAGDDFRPTISKITEKNAGVPASPIDLFDQGIIKKANNGMLMMEDINKIDPEHFLGTKEARSVLDPVLQLVNRWSKASPKSGKEGVEQLLRFKEQLNGTLDQAWAKAESSGQTMAYNEVEKFAQQIKSAYVNTAMGGGPNSEKLIKAMVDADTAYARMQVYTDKFTKAVNRGGKLDRDHYAKLYENMFANTKLSTKSVVNKSEIDEVFSTLGKYDASLAQTKDRIAIRKATAAIDPWMRPGQASNVQTTAGMVTGTLSNPIFGGFVFGAASPKVQGQTAKMAGKIIDSMYNGMDFVRKLPVKDRLEMLKTPEALQQFYKTILEVPGIEAQVGRELGQMLQGGQQ